MDAPRGQGFRCAARSSFSATLRKRRKNGDSLPFVGPQPYRWLL